MPRADAMVLGGVGVLALACLVVCGLYLYWISGRHRDRLRRLESQTASARADGHNEEQLSGVEATMGTQLSQRCKTSLYRATFSHAHHAHHASMVFLFADSREDARTRAIAALSAIHGIAAHQVNLCNLASFRELVDIGVSDDEDLRIFEVAWKGADVTAWAEHPLFLTDDPGLLGKWAELYADLARELSVSAIDRARH